MPPVPLVDDDVAVRRTIARFQTFEGFVVVEANNGEEAVTYLRTGAGASVIVLDLRMRRRLRRTLRVRSGRAAQNVKSWRD